MSAQLCDYMKLDQFEQNYFYVEPEQNSMIDWRYKKRKSEVALQERKAVLCSMGINCPLWFSKKKLKWPSPNFPTRNKESNEIVTD